MKQWHVWAVGIILPITLTVLIVSIFGASGTVILTNIYIAGFCLIVAGIIENKVFTESGIDRNNGSKIGNILAKVLGILLILVILIPLTIKIIGDLVTYT